LCLNCGLCCNGTLFGDVKLQPPDDPGRLAALGLAVPVARGRPHLPQPCAALEGCRCRVYVARPSRCQQFDCALLLAVGQGRTTAAAAQRVIANTLRRVARVDGLLRQLGAAPSGRPLAQRVRRLSQRLVGHELDADSAPQFSELTLAFHALNLQLQKKFLSLPSG
jgi:hypothetical protein